ncbi:glycosyltransferase family 4 protein [Acinetobacter ursingii]|uniref:glycosyltransferase family 4 protein n=1 Tax=Acinetobacter ursingii TaxID=108980 RepID=UPI0032B323AF
MKKIFILSNASGWGGSEKSMEIISKELCNNNLVYIFVENEKHYNNLQGYSDNLKVYKFLQGNSIIFTILNISYFLINFYLKIPTMVIANTNKSGLYLSLCNIFTGSKVKKLYFIRDFEWQKKSLIKFLLSKNAQLCIPSLAVANYASYFSHSHIVVPDPINVSYNILPKEKENNKIVEIICVARISKWKGIEYLINACSSMNKEAFKLKIIGGTDNVEYLDELKSMVNINDLSNNIEFVSFVSNMDQFYLKSDIVVSSSISDFGGPETFGRTIIEGWNFCKPVVSFDCGGPSFIITHNIDGLLVPEKNEKELARALTKLIENKELREFLGNNGRKNVVKNYSSDKIAEKLVKLMD